MKLAVAQINCTVGDLAGNAKKILDFTNQAKNKGASLVVTPELALSGYPPEDLLLRKGFCLACINTFESLVKEVNGITLLLGHPYFADSKIYNAASVICNGKIIVTYLKNNLLNDAVFKECRYFEPGSDICIFCVEGIKFGVNISTDVWQGINVTRAKEKGAEVLIVLSASPYHIKKQASRHKMIRQRICETGITVIYANLVGGQDELVFDGASFVINNKGELTHQFDEFTETLGLIELQNSLPMRGTVLQSQILQASIYSALCLGVKDYIGKNGFTDVLLGLSGGIDSALTLVIAVDALGPDRVWAVMMPSEFTADISLQDSRTMSKTLGVRYSELPIKPVFDQFVSALISEFQGLQKNDETETTEENLQARIRGTLLMALSNKHGAIVLTTGNKSEMATGYCTLYGDMAGGFAILKDISKTMVYQLCQYRNGLSMVIPERVIRRAPSAELRLNQMDQDSLPSYDILDGIIEAYVEQDKSLHEIIGMGYTKTDVRRTVDLICASEYKRRQSPMGICVTQRSFSKDWYYPITSKYKDEF
ncbi:MAG: NAD+ synthase [Betaproteobacteria bacterium]|nr:MAG: NAD+ synthase [Betaproteobacteria bacterium]